LKGLILPKVGANTEGKGKARVLTSNEALKELIEKEKKKKEEEAKQTRREERERKKLEKQE